MYLKTMVHCSSIHLIPFLVDEVAIDGDDPKHIKWLYQQALHRANQFGITGVTYRLTQGNMPETHSFSRYCEM